MNGGGIGNSIASRLIADATDKTVALDNHVDRGGDKQLHSPQKRVYVYLLVLADDSLSEVNAEPAAEGVETGTMESFTPIDILIGTQTHGTAEALTALALRHGALKPLRRIVIETVDNEFHTDVEQQQRAKVGCPGMLPQPVELKDTPHAGQLQKGSHDENDSDNCSSCHNLSFYAVQQTAIFIFDDAKLLPFGHYSKFLGYSAAFCDERQVAEG